MHHVLAKTDFTCGISSVNSSETEVQRVSPSAQVPRKSLPRSPLPAPSSPLSLPSSCSSPLPTDVQLLPVRSLKSSLPSPPFPTFTSRVTARSAELGQIFGV